jgi:uncharacterized membrane protein YidH (DUF202 family)
MKYLSLTIPDSGSGDSPVVAVHGAGNMPQGGPDSLANIISVGIELLIVATLILSLGFLVWGGLNWLMSEGDKQKLSNARQKVVFSILGLIIVFLSFFIVNAVNYFFLGNTATPFVYPSQ